MAIRKVISRSIEDSTIATADLANSAVTDAKIAAGSGGAGAFQGDNASGALNGDTTNGKKDIFRINEATLNTSVTIASGDNASCAGPLTVSTSGTVNLTVNGNLTIV